jgi:hypothetical protein
MANRRPFQQDLGLGQCTCRSDFIPCSDGEYKISPSGFTAGSCQKFGVIEEVEVGRGAYHEGGILNTVKTGDGAGDLH